MGSRAQCGAVQLDGVESTIVDLGNPTALQLTGSMTISAWINSAGYPGDDAAIVSKRTGPRSGYQLDTTVDKGPRTIGFKLTSSTGGQMFRYGATSLQTGTWYHVAGVYDATAKTLHVYLNGQLDDGPLQGTVAAPSRTRRRTCTSGSARPGASIRTAASTTCVSTTEHSTWREIQTDMTTPLGNSGTSHRRRPRSRSPANGAQVANTVNVTATASDDVAVAGVQLVVDGRDSGTEDTTAPFVLPWDSQSRLRRPAHAYRPSPRHRREHGDLASP